MAQSTCKIGGCEKPVNTMGWCRMHYIRYNRHGDPLTVHVVSHRKKQATTGRALVYRKGHLLANAEGWIYEYRLFLFEFIGGDEHPCHWCGESVFWSLRYPRSRSALVVDHVDGDATNDALSNLVPSCNPCNVSRTAGDWHGTLNGYTNHRCRCDSCRLARTSYSRIERHRRESKLCSHPKQGWSNGFIRCLSCGAELSAAGTPA